MIGALRARGWAGVGPGLTVPWAFAAVSVLLGSALLGLGIGPVGLGFGPIAREIASHIPFLGVHSSFSGSEDAILWQLRAPRVVLGILVGAMLASAGAAYQGVFRNPLADPYLLGAAAGAGLGATLVIAYGHGAAASRDLRPALRACARCAGRFHKGSESRRYSPARRCGSGAGRPSAAGSPRRKTGRSAVRQWRAP